MNVKQSRQQNLKNWIRSIVVTSGRFVLIVLCLLVAITIFYDMASAVEMVTVKNQRFGFSIDVPLDWKTDQLGEKDSFVLDTQNINQSAGMVVVAVDIEKTLPLETFIPLIEMEVVRDLPFVHSGRREVVQAPTELESMDQGLSFREYRGEIQGEKVCVLTGYRIKGTHGYAISIIFLATEEKVKHRLYQMVASFKLN